MNYCYYKKAVSLSLSKAGLPGCKFILEFTVFDKLRLTH
jgi:hypothetical protein